jgi:hypothetical protein
MAITHQFPAQVPCMRTYSVFADALGALGRAEGQLWETGDQITNELTKMKWVQRRRELTYSPTLKSGAPAHI